MINTTASHVSVKLFSAFFVCVSKTLMLVCVLVGIIHHRIKLISMGLTRHTLCPIYHVVMGQDVPP
mgnify:FL=1